MAARDYRGPMTTSTAQQEGMSTGRALLLGGGIAAGLGVLLTVPPVLGVSLLPACPFRTLTGMDCPFCGGTRAAQSLLKGDVGASLDYNLLVPILAVLAVGLGVWWLLARTTTVSFTAARSAASSRAVWIGIAVALVLFWIARNLPAFAYLNSAPTANVTGGG